MRFSPFVSATLAAACLAAGGWLAFVDDAEPVDLPSPTAQPSATPTPTGEPSVEPTGGADPSPLPTLEPVPGDRDAVIADLGALLADPEYDTQGPLSVVVLDEFGRLVIEKAPDVPLLPASTMKLVTAAAVLQQHGVDGRIQTPVLVDGPVSSRGTLDGNVIVRAAGDPTLASEEYRRFVYPARPSTPTEQLGEVLRAAGIAGVSGGVVVDPGAYADQRRPEGWRDVYLSDFDARFITGLTVDAGLEVTVNHPRSSWGDLTPEQIEDDGVVIDLAGDPVVRAAEVFRQELARARISVRSEALVDTASPAAEQIGVLEGPPMSEVLRFMVKESDNHLADTLLRELGATITGRSTWASSAAAVEALLGDVGVDLGGALIADGSGLSRDDLLSARVLAELDQVMSASAELGPTWADIQAVAGRDGTLRRRLRGTIADGRFRGKTGTLNDVRSLVGAVEGPDGRRYHVAVVANGGEVWRASTLADQMILRLTRSLWCGVEDPPQDVLLACAA